ncbi:MAG: beta-ketoacyl synthase N-terminal-like domain-containing protein [Candidatus Omnitrophica bacterium]|nr:beta-ketoacyl synthase N-terminal-like domain-containing protein [Candidatus Omnitrophota bacterium]
MYINGIGIVFNRGRGVAVLRQALSEGWRPPEGGYPRVYRVSDEAIRDRSISKDLRRTDRFSRMAAAAAVDAAVDGGLSRGIQGSTGLIVATGFGPHATTFKFLDDMLAYRQSEVSPTTFSHSVHNAAASYISLVLQIHGPTLTLTRFNSAFYEALLTAQSWLAEKKVSYVLVGAVDECGPVFEHIAGRKLTMSGEGRIKPFAFSPSAEAVPGEGAVFFLLSAEQAAGYPGIADFSGNGMETSADSNVLAADGFIGDETAYKRFAAGPAMSFAALFGTMPGQLAFSLAAGAVIVKTRLVPHPDFTHGEYESGCRRSVDCIALGCRGDVRRIRISF